MADRIEELPEDKRDNNSGQKSASGRKSLPAHIRSAASDVRKDTIVTSANLYLVARRVLLASLGAVALTIEETNEFIEKLVERGELAEHELSHLVEDLALRKRAQDVPALPDTNAGTGSDARLPIADQSPDIGTNGRVVQDAEVATLKTATREGGRLASFPVAALADRVEVILDRLNVPTRSDIEALSAKIGRLSDKVAQMRSRGAPQDQTRTNGAHDEVVDIVANGDGGPSRRK